MKIEVLTNRDHVVFIKYYPGLAIVFEPDVTGKNAICPSDIFVRDLDTIKDFKYNMIHEYGFVQRLNLMS